eukprot:IDg17589t1
MTANLRVDAPRGMAACAASAASSADSCSTSPSSLAESSEPDDALRPTAAPTSDSSSSESSLSLASVRRRRPGRARPKRSTRAEDDWKPGCDSACVKRSSGAAVVDDAFTGTRPKRGSQCCEAKRGSDTRGTCPSGAVSTVAGAAGFPFLVFLAAGFFASQRPPLLLA